MHLCELLKAEILKLKWMVDYILAPRISWKKIIQLNPLWETQHYSYSIKSNMHWNINILTLKFIGTALWFNLFFSSFLNCLKWKWSWQIVFLANTAVLESSNLTFPLFFSHTLHLSLYLTGKLKKGKLGLFFLVLAQPI
jgi:hypothetical protein